MLGQCLKILHNTSVLISSYILSCSRIKFCLVHCSGTSSGTQFVLNFGCHKSTFFQFRKFLQHIAVHFRNVVTNNNGGETRICCINGLIMRNIPPNTGCHWVVVEFPNLMTISGDIPSGNRTFCKFEQYMHIYEKLPGSD